MRAPVSWPHGQVRLCNDWRLPKCDKGSCLPASVECQPLLTLGETDGPSHSKPLKSGIIAAVLIIICASNDGDVLKGRNKLNALWHKELYKTARSWWRRYVIRKSCDMAHPFVLFPNIFRPTLPPCAGGPDSPRGWALAEGRDLAAVASACPTKLKTYGAWR